MKSPKEIKEFNEDRPCRYCGFGWPTDRAGFHWAQHGMKTWKCPEFVPPALQLADMEGTIEIIPTVNPEVARVAKWLRQSMDRTLYHLYASELGVGIYDVSEMD